MISLIPLCFIALWILSHWFSPEQSREMIAELVHRQVPQAAEVLLSQVKVIRHGGQQWMTGSLWGLIPLIWSGAQFYETLERILTAAWARRPLRGYLHRKLVTFLTLLCATLFFGVSLLATSTLAAVMHLEIKVLGVMPRDFPWLWKLTGQALPFLSSVLMFFLLYKFLPNTKVPGWLAFKAAVVAGIVWEYSKSVFSRFVAQEELYQHLYGSLSSVVVFMFWIYFSAVILLLGAELAAAYHFDEGMRDEGMRDEG
jgi:membrane protein